MYWGYISQIFFYCNSDDLGKGTVPMFCTLKSRPIVLFYRKILPKNLVPICLLTRVPSNFKQNLLKMCTGVFSKIDVALHFHRLNMFWKVLVSVFMI